MSRKSVRLQSRRNERPTPAILNRKRKSDRDEEIVLSESRLTLNTCSNKSKSPFFLSHAFTGLSLAGMKMEEASSTRNGINNPRARMDETLLMTPKDNRIRGMTWSRFRSLSSLLVSPSTTRCPLPNLNWADSQEVWEFMMKKDALYKRDSAVLKRHPAILASMRAILLDWLIEVCEVYRLHRDTYYLSLDFVDRFLATQNNVPKQQLQLIGITALFLAAKIEEIYPPKLSEFAYVTDGACTEDDILVKELIMLKALNWDLSPVTVFGWVNTFMQLADLPNIKESSKNFVYPHYDTGSFVKISKLVDLCMLDVGSLAFSYSLIAASALWHATSKELTFRVSGYAWNDLRNCVHWMAPFAATIRENEPAEVKEFEQIPKYDMHNIQTHDNDLSLLEDAQTRSRLSFAFDNSDGFLTPPNSLEKSFCLSSQCTEDDDDDIQFISD